MKTLVKEVMTTLPHTIGDDQTLEAAKQQLYKLGVRHLPVLHGGKIVGILSDRDVKLAFAVEKEAGKLAVRDVCSGEVYTVSPNTEVSEMCERMGRDGIGSAVVIDDKGHAVGIFTTTDACKVLARLT